MKTKFCQNCGKELTKEQLYRGNTKFCSRQCATDAHKKITHTCTCIVCGAKFEAATERAKICSPNCKRERARQQYLENGKISTSPRKSRQKHKSNLTAAQVEAQAHGMSYGQWRAQQYLKSIPKIDTKV